MKQTWLKWVGPVIVLLVVAFVATKGGVKQPGTAFYSRFRES